MLRTIEQMSENERLELFNVEELESRLEMAAAAATTNGACNNEVKVDANGACW